MRWVGQEVGLTVGMSRPREATSVATRTSEVNSRVPRRAGKGPDVRTVLNRRERRSSKGRHSLAVVCVRVHAGPLLARRRGGGAGGGELWRRASGLAGLAAAAAVAKPAVAKPAAAAVAKPAAAAVATPIAAAAVAKPAVAVAKFAAAAVATPIAAAVAATAAIAAVLAAVSAYDDL